MLPIAEKSNASVAFFSCSTFSELEQNEVQFQYKEDSASDDKTSITEDTEVYCDETHLNSRTATIENSRSSSLFLQTNALLPATLKNDHNKMNTLRKVEISRTREHEIVSERNLGGSDIPLVSDNLIKTPLRVKRRKRHPTLKQSLKFLRKMIKSKRQRTLIEQYKNMTILLRKLIKKQKNVPPRNKKERKRGKILLNKIRTLFKVLRKKLQKRDHLERVILKRRMQKERRNKVHLRLKKILRVVYFKRQQRIRNMRNLRIRERKRLADTLMLQVAKLRARANRLTGGRETKAKFHTVSCSKPNEVKKIEDQQLMENPQIQAKTSMQALDPKINKVKKRSHKKSRRPRKKDKFLRKKKVLDTKIDDLHTHMEKLLKKFSKLKKNKKSEKIKFTYVTSKTSANIKPRVAGGEDVEKSELKKKTKRAKTSRSYRKRRQAWWRKDRLKAAKIKENPKESYK